MNPNTGEIYELQSKEAKDLSKFLQEELISVENNEMTDKQRKTKQVSLRDNRSVLGKRLGSVRKNRKIGRNDLCQCGSGIKYKKCCLKK